MAPSSKQDQEQLKRRVAECQQRLAANPNDRSARYPLAHALRDLGHPAEALAYFQADVRDYPDDPWSSLLGATQCLLDLQRAAEALAVVEQVLVHEPRWPDAHALHGECLLALGRIDEAKAAFKTGLTRVLPHEECEYRLLEGLQNARRLSPDALTGQPASPRREQLTLFAPVVDHLKVSKRLRETGAQVKFEGPSHQWQKAIGYFKSGSDLQSISFSFDPAYHREPNWSTQMDALRDQLARFPDTARKPRALVVPATLRWALKVAFEPEATSASDPRVQALCTVAALLDGVLVTPSALCDAQGRVLLGAEGAYAEDPKAAWPRAVAAIPVAELPVVAAAPNPPSTPNQPTPESGTPRSRGSVRGPGAPDSRRVAQRAIALTAVTARAIMEQGAAWPEAQRDHRDLMAWVRELAIDEEFEPAEQAALAAPLGRLDPTLQLNSSWRLEGLGVLAWSLGLWEMPPHDQLVDSNLLWRSLGLCNTPAAKSLLADANRRSPAEIGARRDRLFAIHWRLRQFALRPSVMDFAQFARTCWFGPLDLSGLPLVDGDLSLRGQRLDRVGREVLSLAQSSAQERHLAINWLCEGPAIYSAASVAT